VVLELALALKVLVLLVVDALLIEGQEQSLQAPPQHTCTECV
jgi:hypothetical protein